MSKTDTTRKSAGIGSVKSACGLAFYASDAPQAQRARARLVSQYGECSLDEADTVVAVGGDGTMLRALHECLSKPVPIFGMNCGKVGFLMNPFREEGLQERVRAARGIKLHPLLMHVEKMDGTRVSYRAFNEVTIYRRTHFTTHLRVFVDGKVRLEELICDGVLVATPMGSSAYNHSAYGPILPLGSKVLSLTPVAPYRPRRWRGAVLPRRARLRFEVLEPERRPANATADFHDLRDVRAVEVREDKDLSMPILFDPEEELSERI